MIAGSLTDLAMLLLLSTLVLGSAIAVNFALRRRPAELRHLIWVIAFGLLLLVPPASRWLPKIEVSSAPSQLMTDSIATAVDDWIAASPAAPAQESGSLPTAIGPSATAVQKAAGANLHWALVVVAIYSLIAGALLLRLMLVLLNMHRHLSRLAHIEDSSTEALVDELAGDLEVHRDIRLRKDDRQSTPWTWGVLHPVIVVPRGFETWPLRDRRNALVHEIAHIRRLDFVSALLAQICIALYWYQPLAWFAEQARRREAEYASDDRVVELGASPAAYANQLLGIARTIHHPPPPAPAAAMARPGRFLSRVARILDPKARRKAMKRSTKLYAVAAGALLALSLIVLESPSAVSQEDGNVADVGQILNAGPATETELNSALDYLLENGQEDRARSLLVQWLTVPDESFQGCLLCAHLIDQRETSGNAHLKRTTLMSAFGDVEVLAQSQAKPDLLIRLVNVLTAGESDAADNLSIYYLTQARGLGELSDLQKMMAVNLLTRVGQYDAALAMAQEVHDNSASPSFQTQTTQWIRFIEGKQELVTRLERQLSPAEQTVPATYEYMPAYKQAPVYPAEAAERKAEGNVVVEYTVTATGRTRDPVVVSSTDNIFDQSALSSVAAYRYLPRVQNGVPVEVPGVRVKISFRLE